SSQFFTLSLHDALPIFLYWIGVILLVLFFVFRNNKLPSLASASIQLSIILLVLYVIYYVKSILNLRSFYKHISKKTNGLHIVLRSEEHTSELQSRENLV